MRIARIRLKYLAELPITNGLGLSGAFDEASWPRYVRTTDLLASRSLRDDVFASQPPKVAAAAMLRRDDIVMTAAGATIGKSYMHTTSEPACYAGYLVRFRANRGCDPRFVAHWMQSSDYWSQIEAGAVRSTIDNFSAGRYRQLLVPALDLELQRRIADFLDYQVNLLDAALAVIDEQRALLDERRARRVLATVRGEDVPAGRRQVAARWLRSLPESWPLVPVASQFEVLLGKMLNEPRATGPRLKPYLRNTNVQWDEIDAEDLKYMHFEPGERHRYSLVPGDLLICEGGQPGRCAIWDGRVEEIYYQKALHRARSRGRSHPRWLFYILRAAVAEGAFDDGSGTTIAHLTGEQLRAFRFPSPAHEVQRELIDRLDLEMRDAEETMTLLERQAALLRERKLALITAAVTGEFDVSTASTRAVIG